MSNKFNQVIKFYWDFNPSRHITRPSNPRLANYRWGKRELVTHTPFETHVRDNKIRHQLNKNALKQRLGRETVVRTTPHTYSNFRKAMCSVLGQVTANTSVWWPSLASIKLLCSNSTLISNVPSLVINFQLYSTTCNTYSRNGVTKQSKNKFAWS